MDLQPGFIGVRDYIGKKYEYLSLLGSAIRILIWWIFGKKILNPIRNTARLTCSEFVSMIMKDAVLPDTDGWDPETVSPEDIFEYVETHKKLFKKAE